MVFKVVNGIAQPLVGPLWDSSQTLAENVTTALIMNTSANYLGHYKNRIVNNWEAFDPQKVLSRNCSSSFSLSSSSPSYSSCSPPL